MYSISFKKTAIVVLVFAFIWACSDSTGTTQDTPPEPPSFDEVQMDLSIFEGAIQMREEGSEMERMREFAKEMPALPAATGESPYEAAAWFALTTDMLFQSFAIYPTLFFDPDAWGDPSIDGDIWVWEFTTSFEGETLSMRITAETTSNGRIWELRYSFSSPDEPDINNALFIRSEVSLDGNTGNWQIYDFLEGPADDLPLMTFDFEIEDGVTVLVDVNLPQNPNTDRLLYEVDGVIASLSEIVSSATVTTIQWNRETGSGWIQSQTYNDGVRSCWDENFMTTDC